MSEWVEKPLGELANLEIGGTPSRDIPAYWADANGDGHPWVSIADLRAGRVAETSERITDLGVRHSNVKPVKRGTVLMTFKLTIGEVALANCDLFTNEAIVALTPKSREITSGFLFHALPGATKSTVTDAAIKGATLNKDKLAKIKIRFPVDLASQDSIARILRALDTQIEATEGLIAKQERVRAGLMQDLFTRGVDEHGQLRPPRDQAPHLYHRTELGWLPLGWEVQLVGDVTESIIDGPFGSNLKSEHYVDEPGVRVIRLQNIQVGFYDNRDSAYVSERHAQFLAKFSVLPGDVLIASLGDDRYQAGRACCYPSGLGPAINKADCFRVRADKAKAISEFLMLTFNSDRMRPESVKLIQGVTRQRINVGNFKQLAVAMPKLAEQRAVVEAFERASAPLDRLNAELRELGRLKSGLMQDLLSGKVPVTPLLERTREGVPA